VEEREREEQMFDWPHLRHVALACCVAGAAVVAVPGASAAAAKHHIAFLAASSQNGFNQAVFEGIKKRATELGDVDVEIFDGEFNAAKQYAQVEDLVAAKKFDGIIILPNDSVGVANALSDAIKANVKVVTTLFPVGPKLDTLEPQIPGLTATVASNPAIGAREQADGVVAYCADKNPCNVVIIIGQKIYPFDNLRYQTYLDTLKPHANIKVVGTVEGNYDPDRSMAGMQDVLQAHKDINVVLSNADQHVVGAEIALQDAGIKPQSLYLSGGGASQIAIEAIRAGRWKATLAFFPVSMGRYAMDAIDGALDGKKVDAIIDSDKIGPVPAMIDKKVLDAHPDFKGEWQG
jgi:ribose transport system substrate-binding protein